MRLRIGELQQPSGPEPDPALWVRIESPSSFASHAAAWALGLAALSAALVLVIGVSLARIPTQGTDASAESASWGVVVAVVVLSIPAHEIIHAIFYPGGLFSPAITFLIWPKRLRFGVYYEGPVSRRRWLLARLAPFIILAVVPAALLAFASDSQDPSLNAGLSLLLLVNSLGSGGDLLSAAWVNLKLRRSPTVGFFSGRAYTKVPT
ncbi:MAG TPA: DUF3267 domain-containing protein [Anaerolineales bacterium]|nr:DUF3267 domain-containing protein [Anaerolineales bacterium]